MDRAFTQGKFDVNMYDLLKSNKAQREMLKCSWKVKQPKNITLTIYDLEDYLEGGSDEELQTTSRRIWLSGKTRCQGRSRTSLKEYYKVHGIWTRRDQEEEGKLNLNNNTSDPPEVNRGVELLLRNKRRKPPEDKRLFS